MVQEELLQTNHLARDQALRAEQEQVLAVAEETVLRDQAIMEEILQVIVPNMLEVLDTVMEVMAITKAVTAALVSSASTAPPPIAASTPAQTTMPTATNSSESPEMARLVDRIRGRSRVPVRSLIGPSGSGRGAPSALATP